MGKTPLLFRLHSCSYPDPLTNRVPGQDYPIEERQWLLGTTYNTGIECLQFVPFLCYHPPILDPSMPSRMFGASIRPSAYSILVSPVSEHGLWPRSSSDYLRVFSLLPCSATQFNEAKRWFESATVLCRFVPDGVAKAEKVRDGFRSFHP